MDLKKSVLNLVIMGVMPVGILLAGEPLSVIYPEIEDDDVIVESQQNYIDNQRYLKEFEKRRMKRVLGSGQGGFVTVVTGRHSSRPYAPYGYRNHADGSPGHFFGIEYQNSDTVLRYYDGYQPNCCNPVYIVRPRPRPPVAVPYRHGTPSGKHR